MKKEHTFRGSPVPDRVSWILNGGKNRGMGAEVGLHKVRRISWRNL